MSPQEIQNQLAQDDKLASDYKEAYKLANNESLLVCRRSEARNGVFLIASIGQRRIATRDELRQQLSVLDSWNRKNA